MADPCEPLSECKDLDGRLLLQRAVYGPQLAFDPGAVAVGGVASRGSALRPLVHLRFEVRWRATGLCQGLPTSVMGLAPGEVVTVGLRTRSTRSFSSLVRDAAERSSSSSHTDRKVRPSAGGGGLGGLLGGITGALGSVQAGAGSAAGQFAGQLGQTLAKFVADQQKKEEVGQQVAQEMADDAIELIPKFIGKFGSFLEDAAGALGGAVGAVAGGVAGAVGAVAGIAGAAGNAVADLVDNVVGGVAGGGAAPGLLGGVEQISEIINTVERSESESSLRETTVTTTTESEQTITRTFGNPYLDRSLQLRFIPVFQRFEVSTRPISGIAGLATILAESNEPAAPPPSGGLRGNIMAGISVGATAGAFAATAVRKGVSAALAVESTAGAASGLRGAMLSSVQKASQASGVARSVRLDQGLTWDRTTTLGNAVHVPLATADIVSKAWGLKGKVTERLQDALTRLRPDAIERLFPRPVVKVVHVFAGLHVEAVPGSCVLPDIPEHLRVIVPGGTTFAPVRLPPAPPDPDA